MDKPVLYGEPGWGSVLVETQLAHYGIDHDFVSVGDLFKDPEARARLARLNPLAQIPTLVLEDGTVMTESAAITLFLADRTGRDDLVPAPSAPERAAFLRWLVFITSNIYPVYTYTDDPARFIGLEAARAPFVEAVYDRAKRMIGMMETAVRGPWFLGARFSALDVFTCTLTHWEPGRAWYAAEAPSLLAIADRTSVVPTLAETWARNFPDAAAKSPEGA